MADTRASNWTHATTIPLTDEVLQLILMLIAEWIDVTGRMPSVAELRHAIKHPGS
jgi:hypothetical protein